MSNSCSHFSNSEILDNIRLHIFDVSKRCNFKINQVLYKSEPRDNTVWIYMDSFRLTFNNDINSMSQDYIRDYCWNVTFDITTNRMNEREIDEFVDLIGKNQCYTDNSLLQEYFRSIVGIKNDLVDNINFSVRNNKYNNMEYKYTISSIDYGNSYNTEGSYNRNEKTVLTLSIIPTVYYY